MKKIVLFSIYGMCIVFMLAVVIGYNVVNKNYVESEDSILPIDYEYVQDIVDPPTQQVNSDKDIAVIRPYFEKEVSIVKNYYDYKSDEKTQQNSITYYEVQTAFSNYSIGDQISIDDYANLSDSEKANCFSAIVTVEFDPKVLFCDLTNNLYINRLSNNYEEETIDGYKYVKKFSFKMNASSNRNIIFYKDDITKNYTYPIVNDNSIVNVTVTTAK